MAETMVAEIVLGREESKRSARAEVAWGTNDCFFAMWTCDHMHEHSEALNVNSSAGGLTRHEFQQTHRSAKLPGCPAHPIRQHH